MFYTLAGSLYSKILARVSVIILLSKLIFDH